MISPEFKKEEYWLIKWPLVAMVLSLIVSGSLLVGLNSLDTQAAAELRRARSELDNARDDVDKIEEEEATIIEHIGRYSEMERDGVVAPEDRLQLQERLLEIMEQHSLFLVNLDIGVQSRLPLQYSEGRTERGREVVLNTSLVEVDLALLHEDDLSRLLTSLMAGPGILQPLSCAVSANTRRTTSFIYLAQHFDANCTFNWYTFQLPPPQAEDDE